MQVDSLNIAKPDTLHSIGIVHQAKSDTTQNSKLLIKQKTEGTSLKKASSISASKVKLISADTVNKDTLSITQVIETQAKTTLFNLYPALKESSDSAVVKVSDNNLRNLFSTSISRYTEALPIKTREGHENAWVLGLALSAIAILIIIRISFQKYLSPILSSLINMQIAEKLMREKNVLIRRVFVLLNFIFILSISLYLFICLKYFKVPMPVKSNLLVYLIIFGTITVFLQIRLLLQSAIGYIFESTVLFKDFIHNNYLINKNLGLYLLPLVISVFYLRQPFADIVFYVSSGIFIISLLYRYLRGLQIILKHNVFLLYSILYLCTLEILPALIVLKFVLLLR
jgi:hypothetical protein